ncbi:hypothetical protein [Shimia sagamensis]|uniref:hypothetical protein n=1 Tax=Shimia sagamensis TaxID=1566352 RepID=UPI0024B7DDD9|nr:hypothetical protein [Shimia sagamensis]
MSAGLKVLFGNCPRYPSERGGLVRECINWVSGKSTIFQGCTKSGGGVWGDNKAPPAGEALCTQLRHISALFGSQNIPKEECVLIYVNAAPNFHHMLKLEYERKCHVIPL